MISGSSVNSAKKTSRTKFTLEEDKLLKYLRQTYPTAEWGMIGKMMGNKTARQCRERWQNYLDPRLNNSEWSVEDDYQLLIKYNQFGPRWNSIAHFFPGRSGNNVRNRYFIIQRQNAKQTQIQPQEPKNRQHLQNNSTNISKAGVQFPIPQVTPPEQTTELDIFQETFDIGLFDTFVE